LSLILCVWKGSGASVALAPLHPQTTGLASGVSRETGGTFFVNAIAVNGRLAVLHRSLAMADEANERYPVNLLRMVAAELHLQNLLVASRDMFGRGYFSLGVGERAALDQAVLGHIAGLYHPISPEFLEAQQAKQPMGFPIQQPSPTPGSPQQP
jgi:hypothetical protein